MKHKYQVIEVIGEGAYGIVYKCKDRETDEIVAIKKFKEEYEKLPKKEIKREIFALQTLKHENIVKFNEAFLKKDHIYLVFGYCEKNLLQLIEENPKGLNPELIRSFVYQMCKAIAYLHKKNIIHRDIKPENLLIKDNNRIQLCDFGFARKMKYNEKEKKYEKMTEYITTRWYRAPELLLGQGIYGPEIDFWAIGCLMGEMADGNPMFAGEDEINQLECIIKLIGNLPEELVKSYNDNPDFNINKLLHVDKPETLEKRYEKVLNPEAIDFMKGLLELSPKKRFKDENIFNHNYFACFKNSENNEKNDEDNKLYYSVSIDKRNKIKIPNLNDNSKEEESKIINIFKYNDDSYIDEKDESNSSEKKLIKNSNSNLDNPLKKQQIKSRFRSDMIDFGKLYLNTENNKAIEKQYNNNKNIFNTESNKYKLIQKKINHKNPIYLIKSQDLPNSPNKNKNQEKFPYLSPRCLFEKKIPESKIDKSEHQKINKSSLFNSQKIRNKPFPLFDQRTEKSKKIILTSKLNDSSNELKHKKKYHHSIDYNNSINNNNSKIEKRKYRDNEKNNKIIFLENEEYIPQKKIINLYENTFKDLIVNSKKKEIMNNPKKIDYMKIVYKNNKHKFLSNSQKKINLELPPIFNFYGNNAALINNNTNKNCKNNFQNDSKLMNNNRYKIDNY